MPWLFLLAPAFGAPLSLSEALDTALRGSPELEVARLELSSASASRLFSAGAYDPAFSGRYEMDGSGEQTLAAVVTQEVPGGASVSLAWGTALGEDGAVGGSAPVVSITQPLLDGAGPASWANLSISRLEEASAELSWRAAVEGTVLQVSDAYWSLLASTESSAQARRSEEIAQKQKEDILERFGAGFSGSGDVLQVERALGVARQSLVVAEAQEEEARMYLARLLGLPLAPVPDLTPTDRPVLPEGDPDPVAALENARTGNVSWLQASLDLHIAALERRADRNGALPSLDAFAAFNLPTAADASPTVEPLPPLDWTAGLSLGVPLPGRSAIGTWKNATFSWEEARYRHAAAEQDLIVSVAAAVRAVSRDRARARFAVETVRAAEQGLAADQELYREGRGSTRDVVRSLEALDAAQVSELQARIDLQRSLLLLEQVQGTLLPGLGIGVEG